MRSGEVTLDSVFHALANPTRRGMAERLAHGSASVSELAEPFQVTLPAIIKHLAVLESAGLVEHWKNGQVRHYRLAPEPLESVSDWVERYTSFWRAQIGSLHQSTTSVWAPATRNSTVTRDSRVSGTPATHRQV